MAGAICVGELLIDFVPTVTGTDLISAPTFTKAPGGAPANVAVGLKRLGASSAFMGKVGDDPFGHFLAQTLEREGVNVNPLRFSKEARTSLAFVSLKADGDRDFLFYRHPSADMLFAPNEVDIDAIGAAKLLHFGSISLIAEISREATLHAVEKAQAAGCLISCDPNLRLELWPDAQTARSEMLHGISLAQVIKISDNEAEFLTGTSDLKVAKAALWHDNMQLLVITKGAAGCAFFTPEFDGEAQGYSVKAVDTTGAGDGFVAGLLQGVLANPRVLKDYAKLLKLCQFANAVGALATIKRGAIPAMPDTEQVQRFLSKQELA